MMRGNLKCMVVLHHKGNNKESEEPDFVHPDSLNDSFRDIGVADKCQVTLVELRGGANNDLDSDMDEGGEEDMDDDFNEEEEEGNKEGAENEEALKQDAKIVEDEIPDKKASDVLFECESDENKEK